MDDPKQMNAQGTTEAQPPESEQVGGRVPALEAEARPTAHGAQQLCTRCPWAEKGRSGILRLESARCHQAIRPRSRVHGTPLCRCSPTCQPSLPSLSHQVLCLPGPFSPLRPAPVELPQSFGAQVPIKVKSRWCVALSSPPPAELFFA